MTGSENASSPTPQINSLKPGLVSVVVPCYRSEKTLVELCERTKTMFAKWGKDYEIILVNDASPDDTWGDICRLAATDDCIVGLNLARNFGQQSAVLCGFHHAEGEFVVTLDDDLQHQPESIPSLFDELIEKNLDCVIARLVSPQHGTFRGLGTQLVRRFTAFIFKLRKDLYFSSFRVLRGQVAKHVLQFRNTTPVVGFLILQATSRVANLPIEHAPRASGSSNYRLKNLLSYFSDMVTGYSVLPLQAAGCFGVILAILGFVVGAALVGYAAIGGAVSSGIMIATATLFLSGLPFICLGILSPYIRRLVSDPSHHPMFLVREATRSNERYS